MRCYYGLRAALSWGKGLHGVYCRCHDSTHTREFFEKDFGEALEKGKIMMKYPGERSRKYLGEHPASLYALPNAMFRATFWRQRSAQTPAFQAYLRILYTFGSLEVEIGQFLFLVPTREHGRRKLIHQTWYNISANRLLAYGCSNGSIIQCRCVASSSASLHCNTSQRWNIQTFIGIWISLYRHCATVYYYRKLLPSVPELCGLPGSKVSLWVLSPSHFNVRLDGLIL